jgi:Flp pilus assembly protein TadD
MYQYCGKLIVCLFLLAATLVVFAQVREHDFVRYDDHIYLTGNPKVYNGLTLPGLVYALTTTDAGYRMPLTFLSHMLDFQFFGPDPGWHHVMSVLFHLANTLLLFFLLNRATGAAWQSGLVAALFALHPLQVESVAWAYERKGVLSCLFWLLTIWAYIGYSENPGLKRYLLVLFCFGLGLTAKPMLVTLPFALLLLDFWPLGRMQLEKTGRSIDSLLQDNYSTRSTFASLIWEKIPLFILAAIWSLLTFVGQKDLGAMSTMADLPMQAKVANAIVSYTNYLIKVFWPLDLAIFYPHPGMLALWKVVTSSFLLLLLSLLALRLRRHHPYVTVGWLWYLGTLVPVIGLVQVGSHGMADRYLYVPLIGLFVIIVWGLPHIVPPWRYRNVVLGLVAAMVISILMTLTALQLQHWKNTYTVFMHALEITDNNYRAHLNVGYDLAQRGKIDEAIVHFNKSIETKPDYAAAHYNLATAQSRQGKFTEAIAHFHKALQIRPDHDQTHNNLGVALAQVGKLEAAIVHFREALRLAPDNQGVRANLELALEQVQVGKKPQKY